jgi:hypothetical protein
MELLIGLPPAPPPAREAQPWTETDLARVAGTYTNNREAIRLVSKDGKLTSVRGREVRKIGPDRLLVPGGDGEAAQELVLVANADGKVLYLCRGGRAFRRNGD